MLHRLKVGKEKVIEEVDGVFHVMMWRCDGVLGPAHCGSYGSIKTTSIMIFCSESFCYKYKILFSPFH